jgi:hypothetical protein
MQSYVNIDYRNTLSLVCVVQKKGIEHIIAECRYAGRPSDDIHEIAFIVDEEYQGRGIGSYMVDRIIAIARVEKTGDPAGHGQFQLESADGGATWKKRRTNIGDVRESTPCLLWDADSGRLSNYYFQRGQGVLKRRVASPRQVWGKPLAWPAPEIVSAGSTKDYHAGNVNATALGKTHFCAFYSGNEIQTEVVIASVPSPRG